MRLVIALVLTTAMALPVAVSAPRERKATVAHAKPDATKHPLGYAEALRQDTTRIVRSDAEWRKLLTPEQYRILRGADTELACSGKYWKEHRRGIYRCAACGYDLFRLGRQVRVGHGLAELLAADPRLAPRGGDGHQPRHGARGSALRALRLAPGSRLRRRAPADGPALLHELGGADIRRGEGVGAPARAPPVC